MPRLLFGRSGICAGTCACIMFAVTSSASESVEEQLAYQLATRYTPYADAGSVFDWELLAKHEADSWWSSPEAIRAQRKEGDPPLAGLHLAIDPGHIGGSWAEWEGRHFRISESDYWVREGELVLEVARRLEARLSELGAVVTLLRSAEHPINPREPVDYLDQASLQVEPSVELNLSTQVDRAIAVRDRAVRLSVVVGELVERARVVNEEIRPDALISLHINAAPWPPGDQQQLVESNHAHVLIFGCLSPGELASPRQQEALLKKLSNGSGPIEVEFARALGEALIEGTGLPASEYHGHNAIRIDPDAPYLWVRNLMLLRQVECPAVMLEPYIANSESGYARLQAALKARAEGEVPKDDDILLEYTEAVLAGVLDAYGPELQVSSLDLQ